MRLKVDHEADALYLSLGDGSATESEEVAPGIIVDYDELGQAVGVEMLHLSKRAPGADIPFCFSSRCLSRSYHASVK